MRLTSAQAGAIRRIAGEECGSALASVRLFGSRLNDCARGGDVDLLIELMQPVADPAERAARIAAGISRALNGRKVDVILSAPNLKRLPIHEIAFQEGQLL